MKTKKKYDRCLLVAGGLHIDELATVRGPVHMQASNPVSWQYYVGGVAANAAQAAHRVQAGTIDVLLAAAVGTDNHAQTLLEALHQAGIKVFEQIVENRNTGRYTAIIDSHARLLLGLADTDLAEQLCTQFVTELISRVTPVGALLDTNLSAQCLSGINKFCEECDIPVGVVAVSPAKTGKVCAVATRIAVLFCNRGEAETLTESHPETPVPSLCDKLTIMGFQRFVLTDGARDIVVQTPESRQVLPVTSAGALKTTNGPGDALAGASFARWVTGGTLHEAVHEFGLPAARRIADGTSSNARLRQS